jgi:hypothetical protein
MTTSHHSTSVPSSRPTALWVVASSTLTFWLAVTALLIFSPRPIDDLIGVPAIFLAYAAFLVGCCLLAEARARRAHSVVARRRLGHLRLSLRASPR